MKWWNRCCDWCVEKFFLWGIKPQKTVMEHEPEMAQFTPARPSQSQQAFAREVMREITDNATQAEDQSVHELRAFAKGGKIDDGTGWAKGGVVPTDQHIAREEAERGDEPGSLDVRNLAEQSYAKHLAATRKEEIAFADEAARVLVALEEMLPLRTLTLWTAEADRFFVRVKRQDTALEKQHLEDRPVYAGNSLLEALEAASVVEGKLDAETEARIRSDIDGGTLFAEALTRWHRATKLVPQCDHRMQKPTGAQFNLDAEVAERIERETMRELERTS
jgi:hypothetical protein